MHKIGPFAACLLLKIVVCFLPGSPCHPHNEIDKPSQKACCKGSVLGRQVLPGQQSMHQDKKLASQILGSNECGGKGIT